MPNGVPFEIFPGVDGSTIVHSDSDIAFKVNGTERARIKDGLRVKDYLQLTGNPTNAAVSPADAGRLIFDKTSEKFMVSENGGPYVPLAGGGGVSGSGVVGQVAFFDGVSSIASDSGFTYNAGTLDIGSINLNGGELIVSATADMILDQLSGNDGNILFVDVTGKVKAEGDLNWDSVTRTLTLGVGSSSFLIMSDAASRIGVGTSSPSEALHVIGNAIIDGKLTVTGAIDPTSIRLEDGSSAAYSEWADGQSAAVSNAGEGRIRFNATSLEFEKSEDGGGWTSLSGTSGVTGSGVAGQIAFWDGVSSLTGDAALYFTDGGKQLSTGTFVARPLGFAPGFIVRGSSFTSPATSYLEFDDSSGAAYGTMGFQASNEFAILNAFLAGPMWFGTNGLERVRILSTGEVGIGTSVPTSKLHVVGDAHITGKLTVDGAIDPTSISFTSGSTADVFADWSNGVTVPASAASHGRIRYNATAQKFEKSENAGGWADLTGSGGGITGSGSADRVALWSGASSLSSDALLFWDDLNNRFGMGTATPLQPIHVQTGFAHDGITVHNTTEADGNRTPLFLTSENAAGAVSNVSIESRSVAGGDSEMVFRTGGGSPIGFGTIQMLLTNDGKLGIGTTMPASLLDVAGDVTIAGKLTVGGAIDPTFVRLTSVSDDDVYIDWTNGQNVPFSNAGEGRIRYSAVSQKFEKSENTGAWVDLTGTSPSALDTRDVWRLSLLHQVGG